MDANSITMENDRCSIKIEKTGGAITDFQLKGSGINPLNFSVVQESAGIPINFKGHFLCLGRWGDPSTGEIEKGSLKHGDFIILPWRAGAEKFFVEMAATSAVECLTVQRYIYLDELAPVVMVTEEVTNIHTIGRLYNIVQHPTIAAPFLSSDTLVDCNCSSGFDYALEHYDESTFANWPQVLNTRGESMSLDRVVEPYSSVFSFIVDPADEYGWITAFSPKHELLIGYCWNRVDYPWINHWLHFEESKILYRGLEFGTTGVHKPFKEIWEANLLHLLGEQTCSYIDADEKHSRSYLAFLQKVPREFKGVLQLELKPKEINIIEKGTHNVSRISHNLNTAHVFSR